jgi:hypothetical protein
MGLGWHQVRAMENALNTLKSGEVPAPPVLPTFPELRDVVGFPDYYDQEQRYALDDADFHQ